jgi:hypothetical protein
MEAHLVTLAFGFEPLGNLHQRRDPLFRCEPGVLSAGIQRNGSCSCLLPQKSISLLLHE